MPLLTLKYRPKKFADLVGQDAVCLILQALVFSNDIPPALLFGGPSGTGKTTAARILAAALNCENPKNGDCCAVCSSCVEIQNGSSISVHEIDAASNGGVDEIRSLKELAQFGTTGHWRVILLDEAHAMSKQAFNALLKVLEEPPAKTIFVLLTTEPNKIMETVRSRSMPINFKHVAEGDIFKRLKQINESEQLSYDDKFLKTLASNASGGVRDAVMMLDQAHRVGVKDEAGLRELLGMSGYPAQIISAVAAQDHKAAQELLESYFMVSASINDLLSGMIQDLQDRFYAGSINQGQMISATKLLWDARAYAGTANRDTRLQMEALVTLLYAVFRTAPAKPILQEKKSPEPAVVKPARLGMDELVGLAEG